jgi:hypothetical protein
MLQSTPSAVKHDLIDERVAPPDQQTIKAALVHLDVEKYAAGDIAHRHACFLIAPSQRLRGETSTLEVAGCGPWTG